MRVSLVMFLASLALAAPASVAQAGCFPVKSEVVSLGEKAARFYAERSLVKSIDEQKSSLESSGSQVGRIVKNELNCKPFPNVLGADEWRCIGDGKVCTGSDAGTKPVQAKAVKAPTLHRASAAPAKK